MDIEKKAKKGFSYTIQEWKGVAIWNHDGNNDDCSICAQKMDDACIKCVTKA